MSEQPKISGPRLTVEIDEIKWPKEKTMLEEVLRSTHGETSERFVVPDHNRTADPLLPLIET